MHSRRPTRKFFLATAAASLALLLLVGVASANFIATAINSANVVSTDTLDPPTSPSANGGPSISLQWTATGDTYASGYNILRGSAPGGPYAPIAQVTPRTTISYQDSPGSGTYYYVLRSYVQNWESANSAEVSAAVSSSGSTGFLNCSADAADSGGDDDGFEVTPGNACADGAGTAASIDSGTKGKKKCGSSSVDRHQFYNYGFSIPAGSTIDGIEIRMDSFTDRARRSNYLCIDLSWDGGASWTSTVRTPDHTTTETTYILGSATDTWGRTWSTTELSDANFRLRVTIRHSRTKRDFYLDWAAVQVTYTLP